MYIYIIQCKDNSYYTGKTTDLSQRFVRHTRGSRYTQNHGIERILYIEEIADGLATQREKEIKKYSRNKKKELINSSRNLVSEFNLVSV